MPREKTPKPPTKTQIATELGDRIHDHLQRFENDPKINYGKRWDKEKGKWIRDKGGLRDYYNASARGIRHRVYVIYITYQGGSYLDLDKAERYLAWLDAGNIGTHHEAFRFRG